ncbi:MAG: helix-turn-helix domain-containing protein [Methanosarcinales archaeon]|nr:MAG: helix-turn-helix domain-containing protein [Methanosarcinales archaeon]
MSIADNMVSEIFKHDKELPVVLTEKIKQKLGISIGEFSEKSGIPLSTLYKILSGERDPNLRTFRRILNTVGEIENEHVKKNKKFIAVVCSRGCLDVLEKTTLDTGRNIFDIREYAVTSMEEAMIAAIQAEKDDASAIVCAPIVSSTVEKVVSIPVATIKPKLSIASAIELAAKKTN